MTIKLYDKQENMIEDFDSENIKGLATWIALSMSNDEINYSAIKKDVMEWLKEILKGE